MTDRQWTGVILTGGKSSRMGRDKALIEVDGMRMLDRTVELLRPHVREILIIGDPAEHINEHATTIPDDEPGKGPVGGITTAFKHARYVRLLVLACDLPAINDHLLVTLKKELDAGFDAIIPMHDGLIEPLAAAYHKHCIEAFEKNLRNSVLKMSDAIAAVRTLNIEVKPGNDGWPADLFRNLNTPTDL